MNDVIPPFDSQASEHVLHIACVSYLNSRPLVEGLENDPRVRVSYAVPSRLVDELTSGRADVALLPVIDLPRVKDPQVLRAGGIGCDGPTLTVRLFSRKPLEQTTVVGADPDSHTSVALSKIVFARRFGLRPAYVELSRQLDRSRQLDTILLIGDKVITQQPNDRPYQLDLGQAWKELTGLPFVFAIWTANPGVDTALAERLLTESRRLGMTRIESILRDHAVPRGWPVDIARNYLTGYLKYQIGDAQLHAIARFHQMAQEAG